MYKGSITCSARRKYPGSVLCKILITNRVSTLRSAIELKSVFDQIQAAEKAGNLSPEEKKRLEEQAAEKGLQALFKVCQSFQSDILLFNGHIGNETRNRICPA